MYFVSFCITLTCKSPKHGVTSKGETKTHVTRTHMELLGVSCCCAK